MIQIAKELHKFPREVDELTPDEIWEIAAEFKLQHDEWEEKHPKQ